MTRSTPGFVTKKRHKKIYKLAKGYRGRSKNCYRVAIEKVEKALQYAYRDRRNKKRDFRALWIQRINAAVRAYGITYSKFMGALKSLEIDMDRKILAELAVSNSEDFKLIVDQALKALRP